MEVRLSPVPREPTVLFYVKQRVGKEEAVGTLYQFKRKPRSYPSFPEANLELGSPSQQPLWTCGETER